MEPDTIDNSKLPQTGVPDLMDTMSQDAVPAVAQTSRILPDPSTTSNTIAQGQEHGRSKSPQLTDALEALLGGLAAPTPLNISSSKGTNSVNGEPAKESTVRVEPTIQDATSSINPETEMPAISVPSVGGLLAETGSVGSNANAVSQAESRDTSADVQMDEPAPVEKVAEDHVAADIISMEAHAVTGDGGHEAPTAAIVGGDVVMLESAHEGNQSGPAQANLADGPILHERTDETMIGNDGGEGEHPEWEVDSSPIESSSDDSSDDSSSEDDSDDEENAYKLLSPEEQARILMADGGSDDEGDGKKKGVGGAGAGVKSKNEVPEVVIPKPDVTITPEMPIINLGVVEIIVQNIALIKGRTSGEYQVLESGSVLCLEDRSVIGAVAEPLGRVQQPLYSIMFTNADELKAAGLSVGTTIFYSEQHAKYVFTQALKAFKGSDASNIHDEEVGDDEMEFSDDEAELAHRQKVNAAKRGHKTRGGRTERGGHPLQQQHNATATLDYDDAEDGPYKPLARPASLANAIGHGEAPQEGANFGGGQNRGHNRGGRGDRGRGRGDRGRGRGNFQNRGGHSNGYSQSPQNRPASRQSPSAPQNAQGSSSSPSNGFPAPPQAPGYYNMPQPLPPNQGQFPPWPQFPPQQQHSQQPFQQPGFHQAFQNMQQMQQQQAQNGWPNMPPLPPMPNGAFFNPAFFGGQAGSPNQWNQQGGNNGNSQNRQP